MRSLWNDLEAREFQGDLGLRVYTSRLLGRDKSLVLHGGGNTSVKIREKNLFGEEETILYVKGSGWDLETIEPQGFSPVRLAHVLRLAELPSLSDPEMVNQLVTHMLKAAAPAPSIETILHGLMPQKFVDHTHADAVLSVTNTKDGERRIREIYGKRCVVIPYLIPGFDLAQLCAREFKRQSTPETVGMVLLNHGIFSFGETARESYERMIELVTLAEKYLESKRAWSVTPKDFASGTVDANAQTALRRKLSDIAGSPLILKTVTNERTLAFAQHPRAMTISQQVPALLRRARAESEGAQDHARSRAACRARSGIRAGRCGPHREGCGDRGRDLRPHYRCDPARRSARRLPGAASEGHFRRRILGPRAGETQERRQAPGICRRGDTRHRRRLGHRQGRGGGLSRAGRSGGRARPRREDRIAPRPPRFPRIALRRDRRCASRARDRPRRCRLRRPGHAGAECRHLSREPQDRGASHGRMAQVDDGQSRRQPYPAARLPSVVEARAARRARGGDRLEKRPRARPGGFRLFRRQGGTQSACSHRRARMGCGPHPHQYPASERRVRHRLVDRGGAGSAREELRHDGRGIQDQQRAQDRSHEPRRGGARGRDVRAALLQDDRRAGARGRRQ